MSLPGLAFAYAIELGDARDRHRRVHGRELRRHVHEHDRRDVVHRMIGKLQRRGARGVAAGNHRDGVAVGARPYAGFDADQAGRAGAVVDHDGLLEARVEMRPHEPRHAVDRPARRERHDEPDRLHRVALCSRRRLTAAQVIAAAKAALSKICEHSHPRDSSCFGEHDDARTHSKSETTGPRHDRDHGAGRAPRACASGVECGIAHVFVQHTSCSLVITENADPAVRRDLETLAQRWAPDGDKAYRHDTEGDDDMAAHARSMLAGSSSACR